MKFTKLKYLPNILTFCNMTIGIFITFSMIHDNGLCHTKLTIYLVYIAVILDLLDGYLARHLNAVSEMGKQLDSFADFITFGIAPISIFAANLDSMPWFMMIIIILYPLAGAFRLVRYNLQKSSNCFTGLPITAAGFIMVTVLFINTYLYSDITEMFISFYLLLSLVLSFLMISKLPFNRILKIK